MKKSINELKRIVHDRMVDYKAAVKAYRFEKSSLDTARNQLTDTKQAQDLIQHVAQAVQQRAHEKIASVVSRCLQTIFDEPYIFKIHFEAKRGRTEARLIFERDGYEVDPMTASGGGVIDVAAFALRLACLMLSQPPKRRLLILDEPFKNVSEENGYLDRIPGLLEELSRELEVQFVIVTHINELKIGKVVKI